MSQPVPVCCVCPSRSQSYRLIPNITYHLQAVLRSEGTFYQYGIEPDSMISRLPGSQTLRQIEN